MNKNITLTVLASDFKGNYWTNCKLDGTGCPLLRAIYRADIFYGRMSEIYQSISEDVKLRVNGMFDKKEEPKDFSFEISIS